MWPNFPSKVGSNPDVICVGEYTFQVKNACAAAVWIHLKAEGLQENHYQREEQ